MIPHECRDVEALLRAAVREVLKRLLDGKEQRHVDKRLAVGEDSASLHRMKQGAGAVDGVGARRHLDRWCRNRTARRGRRGAETGSYSDDDSRDGQYYATKQNAPMALILRRGSIVVVLSIEQLRLVRPDFLVAQKVFVMICHRCEISKVK